MPIDNTLSIAPVIHKKILKLMGNRFEITVVSENENEALARIDEAIVEIRRIEKLLTTFDENSQTNLINHFSIHLYRFYTSVPVNKICLTVFVKSGQ